MSRCKRDYDKIKNLKVKNGLFCNLEVNNFRGVTGSFSNLTVENLNVKTLNGRDLDCTGTHNNVSGVITPVQYVNGEPQQPANPGNFNQTVLNELWLLNQLAINVTNLDAAYGRLKNNILANFYNCVVCPAEELNNCNCPITTYAVFLGSITGNILTVTSILDTSYTDCPSNTGTIQVGQYIYGKVNSFLSSVIVEQLSGTPGGVGTYRIENDFDNYMEIVPAQEIVSISNLGIEECAAVPLRLYGVETLSVGPTGCAGSLIDTIVYNINIANKTLSSRLAAVYVQVGYLDQSGEVQIQGLSIDTRQFDPSILSFGEQMNNTVLLPTELIARIAMFNLAPEVNAVVQLAVYIEDGLKVLLPNSETSLSEKLLLSEAIVQSPATNYSVSFSTVSCSQYKVSTGTVSTFVQPPVSQAVNVAFSGFSNIHGSFYVNGGGWYILAEGGGLINLGYTGNAPPGTQIVSQNGNAVTQDFVAFLNTDFVQPPLGGTVNIEVNADPACVPLLNGSTIFIALPRTTDFTPILYGVYRVLSVTSSPDNLTSILTIQNVGIAAYPNPSITTPGTLISKPLGGPRLVVYILQLL